MSNQESERETGALGSDVERRVRPILAFHVFERDPGDGSLLVFAETANKAKSLSIGCCWDWHEYTALTAHRAPEWDGVFTQAGVVETNDELPPGTKPFYQWMETDWEA